MGFFYKRRPRPIDVGKMQVEVVFPCDPEAYEITATGTGEHTVYTWWDKDNLMGKSVDAIQLRDAFEEVGSPAELHRFLQKSGPFRSGTVQVSWQKFQEWQAFFRQQRLRVNGFGPQPEHAAGRLDLSERIVDPNLKAYTTVDATGRVTSTISVTCESVVETIAALNLLDRLRRAEVKACARPGCPKLFDKKDPRKRYCTRACAVKAARQMSTDKRRGEK